MTTVTSERARRVQALAALQEYAQWQARLPELVTNGADAGLAKGLIADVIGVHRSTVYDILRKHREQASET